MQRSNNPQDPGFWVLGKPRNNWSWNSRLPIGRIGLHALAKQLNWLSVHLRRGGRQRSSACIAYELLMRTPLTFAKCAEHTEWREVLAVGEAFNTASQRFEITIEVVAGGQKRFADNTRIMLMLLRELVLLGDLDEEGFCGAVRRRNLEIAPELRCCAKILLQSRRFWAGRNASKRLDSAAATSDAGLSPVRPSTDRGQSALSASILGEPLVTYDVKILFALAPGVVLKYQDLATHVDVSQSTIKKRIPELLHRRLVERKGPRQGVFITPGGKHVVDVLGPHARTIANNVE